MPEGRLSMAFPYAVGQLPLAYNGFSTNRPLEENPDEKYTSRYLDMPNEPLYPFGYGLNYSPVSYRDLQLDRDRMEPCLLYTSTLSGTNSSNYFTSTLPELHRYVKSKNSKNFVILNGGMPLLNDAKRPDTMEKLWPYTDCL